MKILIVGSGGREHAVSRAFKKGHAAREIFCADGNAGIAHDAQLVNIKPSEIEKLADFAVGNRIDLTFVGGETALALGIVDEFERRNLKIVGAGEQAAQLEASKTFAKDFMLRHKIPTAEYVSASSVDEALEILQSGRFGGENSPIVIKADGLAAGKGVVVAENRAQAVEAVSELENLVGSEAAQKIVLEECLYGREVSLLLFADGESFALMPPVRDHKRIGENDCGANTGGMGTITDASLLTAAQISEVTEQIIAPTLAGCRAEGFPFRGILFLGLMLTDAGARLLEYNVRFGDPETQAILPRLETDLAEICAAICERNLANLKVEWKSGASACVVLAAKNYPQKPQIGDRIFGLENVKSDVEIFHAGTAKDADGRFITAGGRVLSVAATAEDLDAALRKTYDAIGEISFDGMQFRRDIGK